MSKQTRVSLVGGKGASLEELQTIESIRVPRFFCVPTDVYARVVTPAIHEQLDRLARAQDRTAIAEQSAALRTRIEALPVPEDLAAWITAQIDEGIAYAVRSSATAEDLPTASFAGQQDTYLNVRGAAAILAHVSRCWASLFTERAVAYRIHNGFDHRKVQMAVVVQQMVAAQRAGVLFTADPITGNRKVSSIEAVVGLGEALVSGHVNADVYKVRDGAVIERSLADAEPALTDAQAIRLAAFGRRIEAHFGRPQDIEWCLVDDELAFVQSRPITTLFPVPATTDGANHVYLSVGHQQMMTDAMKPLGLAFWQMTTPRPMAEAGGRLFVDISETLASAGGRAGLLGMVGKSDPLVGDALQTVIDRDFVPLRADAVARPVLGSTPGPAMPTDPAIVAELVARAESSLATLKHEIQTRTGAALLDFIREDIQELRRVQFDPRSIQAIFAGIDATHWLNEKLSAWLGETNAADTLSQSVDGNVTSEMGLALLDVADVIRPHPEVIAYLERMGETDTLDGLAAFDGGPEASVAIRAYLEKYGMRCWGEIDITRPRWSERPAMIVPAILANVKTAEPGASARRFAHGRQAAAEKERDVVERLRALPDGEQKAAETKENIDRVRTFIGYREYPKYGMISRYFVYKQAIMREAERLVGSGVLRDKEEVYFLRYDELQEVVRTGHADRALIADRAEAFRTYQGLTPRRVLTSHGEALDGAFRRDDAPPGALVGLAVSAGLVEGRARVILDMASAELEPGDILVTTSTDPSWTPLFVAISGLVTEVGGLMTHGAVIAREYGLPAVVGVHDATRRIQDGQRIRIDGTNGYVEILTSSPG